MHHNGVVVCIREGPPPGPRRARSGHRGGAAFLGCAALLGLGAAPPAAPRSPEPAVAAILQAHCRAREATVTLQAQFVQTKVFAALGEADTASGVLYYRKPNTVRWQYSAPDTSWTVLRGDKGWSVFPRIRQVQKFDLQRSQAEAVLSIVGFGVCGKDLQTAFEITLAAGEDGSQVLTLVPQEPEIASRFARIDLRLDPQDHLPRQVDLHETSGNTMRFEFRDLARGARIADALFEYAIPKGYEVVD